MYCSLVEKRKYFIYSSLCVNTSGQQSGHAYILSSSALYSYNPPCRNPTLLLLLVCHSNVILTKMSVSEARLILAICLLSLGRRCSSWNQTGHRLYSTAAVAEPVGLVFFFLFLQWKHPITDSSVPLKETILYF